MGKATQKIWSFRITHVLSCNDKEKNKMHKVPNKVAILKMTKPGFEPRNIQMRVGRSIHFIPKMGFVTTRDTRAHPAEIRIFRKTANSSRTGSWKIPKLG